ncbi:MAG: hypothetical protein LUG83_06325 [Lachnospiraceae bacterium]|nr:hypothetical protein [Lachnospiraceae bacterium]
MGNNNIRLSEKCKKILLRIFWAVFSASMLIIFAVALSKPLNNLIPWKMAVYTLVWVVFLAVICAAAFFVEYRFPQWEYRLRRALPIYLAVLGIALFIVSVCLRSAPVSDYADVYYAAYNYANGLEVENWDYFARWNNNVGYMLVLSALFKLGGLFGGEEASYYFVLVLNVLQVLMLLRCAVYLAGRVAGRHSFACSFMALIVGSLWLPLWANTSIFYSDQLSLGAAVFGITLLVRGRERNRKLPYAVLAGFFFGAGIILKATSATLLIALTAAYVLFMRCREYIKEILVCALMLVLVFSGYKMYTAQMPYQENVDILKAPVEYWIALGLNGSGTYGDSEEFAIRCLTAGSYEERKEIAREQIMENIDNLWNIEHIMAKLRQNFGIGDLGAAGYLIWPEHENLLWNWASQEGMYYWKYACLTTSFFFAWLFTTALGGIGMALKRDYGKEDMPVFIMSLAFWGLALFLMLWEAQDKQMYNHSGIMILMLVFSMKLLGEEVLNKCGEIKRIRKK